MASKRVKTICPYCGGLQVGRSRCRLCKGHLDLESRGLTAQDLGPWFLRDAVRPHYPGCSQERLELLARTKQIKPDTVVRGPTTGGFWLKASSVPGLAHLVGFCHECDKAVPSFVVTCGHCNAALSFDRLEMPATLPILAPADASAIDLVSQARQKQVERLAMVVRWQAFGLAALGGGFLVVLVALLTNVLSPPVRESEPVAQQTAQVPAEMNQDELQFVGEVDPTLTQLAEATKQSEPQSPRVQAPVTPPSEAATGDAARDALDRIRDRLHEQTPEQAAVLAQLRLFLEQAERRTSLSTKRREAVKQARALIAKTLKTERDEFMRLRLEALGGIFDEIDDAITAGEPALR